MDDRAALNTDQEIWREFVGDSERGDYIFVACGGGIGINVGGYAVVKPLKDWHSQAIEGASRYWEHRWRDEKAENDRLRNLLKTASEDSYRLAARIEEELASPAQSIEK
jgi:hypothetical protein